MSTCISSHGEYDAHETDPDTYVCKWCHEFDETGALAEIAHLRRGPVTGMEHAIEEAADVIANALHDKADVDLFGGYTDTDDLNDSVLDSRYSLVAVARALAEAGWLAPSPLRKEWAARYTNGGGSVCRTRDEAEAELDRMIRDSHRPRIDEPPAPEIAGIYVRYVTDWELVDRAESGGRADQ